MQEDRKPSRPKKLPKQQRSRLLFSSIKEACRQILETEGVENLSITHLIEVAGISVGSFYQYFPNIEAVVYELYLEDKPPDEEIVRHIRQAIDTASCLEDALKNLISYGLLYHGKRLKLDSEFYQQHSIYYGIVNRMRHTEVYAHLVDVHIELLKCYENSRGIEHADIKGFLLVETLATAMYGTLEYRPDYFNSEEFESVLMKMSMGLINPAH